MATVTNPSPSPMQAGAAARRAQQLREYWNRARGPTTTALGTIAAFFVAYPPLAQGIYYLIRGLWLLLGHGFHGAATGETVTAFLSHSTGLLVLVIGAALCLAAYRRQGSPEVLLIALGAAVGLTVLDIVYVFNRSISVLYVLDAIIQACLVAAWVHGWRTGEKKLTQAATPPPAAPVAPAPPVTAPPTPAQPVPHL